VLLERYSLFLRPILYSSYDKFFKCVNFKETEKLKRDLIKNLKFV